MKTCLMCDKPLTGKRRSYCGTRCANRAGWIRNYGLNVEDYRTLLGDGLCVICGRKMRKVNVDHRHLDGVVRGLVCGTCNKRVLTSVNTVEVATNLLRYLTDPPSTVRLEGPPRVVGKVILERDGRKRKRYYS